MYSALSLRAVLPGSRRPGILEVSLESCSDREGTLVVSLRLRRLLIEASLGVTASVELQRKRAPRLAELTEEPEQVVEARTAQSIATTEPLPGPPGEPGNSSEPDNSWLQQSDEVDSEDDVLVEHPDGADLEDGDFPRVTAPPSTETPGEQLCTGSNTTLVLVARRLYAKSHGFSIHRVFGEARPSILLVPQSRYVTARRAHKSTSLHSVRQRLREAERIRYLYFEEAAEDDRKGSKSANVTYPPAQKKLPPNTPSVPSKWAQYGLEAWLGLDDYPSV